MMTEGSTESDEELFGDGSGPHKGSSNPVEEDQCHTTMRIVPQRDIALWEKPSLEAMLRIPDEISQHLEAELGTFPVPCMESSQGVPIFSSGLSGFGDGGGESLANSSGSGNDASGGGDSGQGGGSGGGDSGGDGASGGRGGSAGGGDGGDDPKKPDTSRATTCEVVSSDDEEESENNVSSNEAASVENASTDQESSREESEGGFQDIALVETIPAALQTRTAHSQQVNGAVDRPHTQANRDLLGTTAGTLVQPSTESTASEEDVPQPTPKPRKEPLQLREHLSLQDQHGRQNQGFQRVHSLVHSLRREPSEIRLRDGVTLVSKEEDQPKTKGKNKVVDLSEKKQGKPKNGASLSSSPQKSVEPKATSRQTAANERPFNQMLKPPPFESVRRRSESVVLPSTHDLVRPPEGSLREVAALAPGDNCVGHRRLEQMPTSRVVCQTECRATGDPGDPDGDESEGGTLCHLCQTYEKKEQLIPCLHCLCFYCGMRCLGVSVAEEKPNRPCPQCGSRIDAREHV